MNEDDSHDLAFLRQQGFDDFVLGHLCASSEFPQFSYTNISDCLPTDAGLQAVVGKERYTLLQQMFFAMHTKFMRAKIGRNGCEDNPTDVSFDFRFGWTLMSADGPAFLGKLDTAHPEMVSVGRLSYCSGVSTVGGVKELKIGSFCSIAEGQYFFTQPNNHPTHYLNNYVFRKAKRLVPYGLDIETESLPSKERITGITIQNDAWIGRNCTIFAGVTIANGCVIGANSTVTKSTEPYGVYVGSPARLVKYRISSPNIDVLLDLAWWDWDHEKINRNKKLLNMDLRTCSPRQIVEAVV